MGGLDCEVDVVESVDTAVEAEGAVSAAWKARCRRYRAATGRGHARPHDPGERLACGSPHAGIPPGADAYRRFNRRESVALSHVVETSRLAHHVGRMSRKNQSVLAGQIRTRPSPAGITRAALQRHRKKIAMNWHLSLTKRSIFCGASAPQSSCNGTIFPQKSSANFLNMRVPWVS